MEREIRRECARSDRNGREFALVLFRVPATGRDAAPATARPTRRLVQAVARRARDTDEIGWFNDGYLCVLLPDTPVAGARVFAECVCHDVARRVARPCAVIYGYPNDSHAESVPRSTLDAPREAATVADEFAARRTGNRDAPAQSRGTQEPDAQEDPLSSAAPPVGFAARADGEGCGVWGINEGGPSRADGACRAATDNAPGLGAPNGSRALLPTATVTPAGCDELPRRAGRTFGVDLNPVPVSPLGPSVKVGRASATDVLPSAEARPSVTAHYGGPALANAPQLRPLAAGRIGRADLFPSFLDGLAAELAKAEASAGPAQASPAPPRPGEAAPRSVQSLLVRPMPWWKRAIDLVGASAGLVAVAPLLAVAALGVRLSGPGPVLFTQRRAGLGGRPFKIYKLRTMVADAEARKAALRPLSEQDGPAFKLTHDPRVTRFGRLLRGTSIDELPQLWNVIKGDMSLVGPRPLPIDESDGCERWQRHRLQVTPGLTCIWQVAGRSEVTFAEWVRMDMAYIRRRTLVNDLWILARTVPAVLLRRGAR